MHKEVITYEDYDGNELTEEFFFHFNEKELTVMNLETPGGLAKYIEKISNTKDYKSLVGLFQKLILDAYGEKSEDGRSFIKVRPDGTKLAHDFEQTEAYSVLFMKLAQDASAAEKFVNECIPKKMLARIEAERKKGNIPASTSPIE